MSTPRRICLDKMIPAELAISRALVEVEELGCDTRLTEACQLLQRARALVADCVDGVGGSISMPNPAAKLTSPLEAGPVLPGLLP